MKKILSTLFVGALVGSVVLSSQIAVAGLKGDPMDNRTPAGRAFQSAKRSGADCIFKTQGSFTGSNKIAAIESADSNTVNAQSGRNGPVVR